MSRSLTEDEKIQPGSVEIFWFVFSAYLFTFFWFFIRSVFFNPSRVMMVDETVRRLDPIGYDLMMMLSHASAWIHHTVSPFASFNNFPPLATLLFTPITLFPIQTAYTIMTVLTLVCFIWAGFFFPYIQRRPHSLKPVLLLIFITSLISYGFQFEIERGQFYTLAFALAFSGVYIFHRHPRLSWIAYILFTLAIQLKMFPALLIFLFIRDWRDWRRNLIRIIGLGLANFVLFFILGWSKFQDFLTILSAMNEDPGIWVGNLSVRSFTHYALPVILKRFNLAPTLLENGNGIIETLLISLLLILLGLGIFQAYRRNRKGIDPFLLFICTSAALVIPPISHDYKLPMLAGPASIFLMSIQISQGFGWWRSIFQIVAVTLFSLAYFSTQYSFVMKSPLVANNFPAIFIMMAVCVTLYFLEARQDN